MMRLLFLIFLMLLSRVTLGDSITIEVAVPATGTLADQNFNNAMVKITGVGDTDNVEVSGPSNLLREGFEVAVDIEGLGQAIFTDAIQAVSNNNSDLGGFGNTSNGFGLILVFNEVFGTYDLLSDLDPVSGFGVIVIGVPHQTTLGSLRFFDTEGPATFTAQVTANCDFDLGDINQDKSVNLLDVGPFVDAISDSIFSCEADINGDGSVDLLDVGGFVDLLSDQ